MPTKYREEVFNVVLAQLLGDRGIASVPEQVFRDVLRGKKWLPDVWIDYQGLTVAIEGKVADPEGALVQARERVNAGRAYMGIAVSYPAELQGIPTMAALRAEISRAVLKIAIVTERGESGFSEGDLGGLADVLRRTHEELVKEDVVVEAVAYIKRATNDFARHLLSRPAVLSRISKVLEIRNVKAKKPKEQTLVQAATAGISALTVFNAVLFQEVLSEHDDRVISPMRFKQNPDVHRQLIEHWWYIIKEINYYPIFHVASEVLVEITASANMERILGVYMDAAREINQRRAALRHDLMGRVYHLLLEDAKYLGAYYTSVPAATLLLKLALNPKAWAVDWADKDALGNFVVGDFACGTGTLLMAAAEAITDNYVRASALQTQTPDIVELHRILIESVIKGYDVLMSALHLTASSLVTRSPETTVKKMELYALPLGGKNKALGSLEFLASPVITTPSDLFSAPEGPQVMGPNGVAEAAVRFPALDLCVMNPPFTRSVGGNLLFGSFPDEERAELQKRMQSVIKKSQYAAFADLTAGLGSPFIVIGHKAVKEGGRLALVLPRALLSGVAWEKSRALFNEQYVLEYVVVSHDPRRWNFSENTELSEVLVILRKNEKPKKKTAEEADTPTVFVNLWENPRSTFDALNIARVLDVLEIPCITAPKGQGALTVKIGEKKYGEAISFPWARLKRQNHWLLPSAFAQSELTRFVWGIQEGRFSLPGAKPARIAFTALKGFGTVGFDRRDIHDGFAPSDHYTPYKAFWGHDSAAVTTMAQNYNKYLSPLAVPKEGRHLRNADTLWLKAGRVLLAERMWLNTHRLNAVLVNEPVLANVWWPFIPNFRGKKLEKILVLWLNSSLGIVTLLSNREETRGAWVDFKKPRLLNLPVLDLKSLSPAQVTYLVAGFDRLSAKPLGHIPEIATDPVRAEIDALFSKALHLPDLAVLREMLAREPVICLKPL